MSVVMFKWDKDYVHHLEKPNESYLVLDEYDIKTYNPSPEVISQFRKVYVISNNDSLEEIASIAVDIQCDDSSIDAVIPNGEFGVYGAGYLAQLLGFKGRLKQAQATRDKRLMKSQVKARGIATANYCSVPHSGECNPEQIERQLGYPVVVKPANGAGSRATFIARDRNELTRCIQLSRDSIRPPTHSKSLIIEQMIQGREYHVDALWHKGQSLFFTISQYFDNRIEQVHDGFMDGAQMVHRSDAPSLYQQIEHLHHQVNDVFEIEDGFTHLEFFLTPQGDPVFSEIATRYGGGAIVPMLNEKFGVDVIEQAVNLAKRREARSPDKLVEQAQYVAWMIVNVEQDGIVTSIPEQERLNEHKHIASYEMNVQVGDRVKKGCHPAFPLKIILTANSQSELNSAMAHCASTLKIGTRAEL